MDQFGPFCLFGPVYFDPSFWTCLFWPVHLDPSNLTRLFGPVYLDPSNWTRLFGPVYLDRSFWIRLFGLVYLDLSVVVSIWVTEGHHGRYQQVTLKVAPLEDPTDFQGITLAPNKKTHKCENEKLLFHSFQSFYFWTSQTGHVTGVDGGRFKKLICRWGHIKHDIWVCADRGEKPLRDIVVDFWLRLVLSTSLLRPMSMIFTMGSDSSEKHSCLFSGFRALWQIRKLGVLITSSRFMMHGWFTDWRIRTLFSKLEEVSPPLKVVTIVKTHYSSSLQSRSLSCAQGAIYCLCPPCCRSPRYRWNSFPWEKSLCYSWQSRTGTWTPRSATWLVLARPSWNISCFRACLGKVPLWGQSCPHTPSMWPPSSILKEPSKGWVARYKFKSRDMEQFILKLSLAKIT